MIMYWSRSASRGLGVLLFLAFMLIAALFDFLTFLAEEHPYIFVIVGACATLLTYKVISLKWGSKQPKIGKPGSESPWQKLVGRKDIRINGVVRNITWKKKPNQPDRFYIDWDGKMILLNVWKKQPRFSVEKGRRYLFSNISCRINKYNNNIEFHYDPAYYQSYYEEWPRQQKQQNHYQKSSQTSLLEELLKEFGCPPSATAEDVKLKRRYWNQVLHPDFNIGKPEKLRNQMEEELKQKNELYDRIMSLMT
jgi:hypothetical protein